MNTKSIFMVIMVIFALILGGCSGLDDLKNASSVISSNDQSITSNDPNTSGTQQITPFSSTVNGIEFGLSPEQLLTKLKELNMELIIPDYSKHDWWPENAVKDGRWYSPKFDYEKDEGSNNKDEMDFVYDTRFVTFFYDYLGNMETVDVKSEISTSEGLKSGDSPDKVIELYGENYIPTNSPMTNAYRYFNGNEYLSITVCSTEPNGVKHDEVMGWSISIHPLLVNQWYD